MPMSRPVRALRPTTAPLPTVSACVTHRRIVLMSAAMPMASTMTCFTSMASVRVKAIKSAFRNVQPKGDLALFIR